MRSILLYASFGLSVVALIFSGTFRWLSGPEVQTPLQAGLNALGSGNTAALWNLLLVISALLILVLAVYALNQHVPRWLILVIAVVGLYPFLRMLYLLSGIGNADSAFNLINILTVQFWLHFAVHVILVIIGVAFLTTQGQERLNE